MSRKNKKAKERCEHCGKLLRLGGTLVIHSKKITSRTPRNTDGTLKRSNEIEYKKVCVNPLCPSNKKAPEDNEGEDE